MAQHDMIIDNAPGLAVREDINAAIQALVQNSGGPVEPTVKYPGQFWLDTSVAPNGKLMVRNQANSAWVAWNEFSTGFGFTNADIGFGARAINTPVAGLPNRFVWNDKPDLSGVDIVTLSDTGAFGFPLSDVGFGARAGANPRFVLNTKTDLTGTDVVQMDMSGRLLLNATEIATLPAFANYRSSITTRSDITIGGSGSVGFNGYVDSSIPAWKALSAGYVSYLFLDKTSGFLSLSKSGASVAANAAAAMAVLLQFSADNGTMTFGTPNVFNHQAATLQYHNFQSTHVAFTKKTGDHAFYWRKSANGLQASATPLMTLDDEGLLTVHPGRFAGSATEAVLAVQTAGNVYLRPNGPEGTAGQAWVTAAGDFSASVDIYCRGGNIKLGAGGNGRLLQLGPNAFMDWNTANSDFRLFSTGGVRWTCRNSDGYFIVPVKGAQPGGGSWADSSDERIKNVLGEYDRGLEAVRQLRPVRYTFKGNDTSEPPAELPQVPEPETPMRSAAALTEPYPNSPHYQVAVAGTEFVGMIAQEVETVLPGMVSRRAAYIDGEPVDDLRDLDTTTLTFALVNAVKELATRVEALEAAA